MSFHIPTQLDIGYVLASLGDRQQSVEALRATKVTGRTAFWQKSTSVGDSGVQEGGDQVEMHLVTVRSPVLVIEVCSWVIQEGRVFRS